MRRAFAGALVAALALTSAGCGAGLRGELREAARRGELAEARARYEALREDGGDDAALLGYVAEALLVSAASAEDGAERKAAIDQLALAGTRGREALEAIARGTGPASIEALAALARVGDRTARRVLRGLSDSPDASVRLASVLGMSAEDDRETLTRFCTDPSAALRAASCARLGELAPESDALELLAERARVDPEIEVRLAVTRALAAFGELAVRALRDRLSDPDPRVRSAALEALLRAERDEGRRAALSILETPPSASTLDAARLLATRLGPTSVPTPDDLAIARLHLVQGLTLSEPSLRAQAALALISSDATRGDREVLEELARQLEGEPDVGVRLTLARTLLEPRRDAAEAALARVLADDHGMVGVQAAALLASIGDERGIERLREDARASDPALRRVAVRALARDALRPIDVREALDDEDAFVRIQAAGGILAALAATRS